MFRVPKIGPLAFKLVPWERFEKSVILWKIGKSLFLGKWVIELCLTRTIKLRYIERSVFFLLDPNGQTWVYRLVSDQPDVRLWRNPDFPTRMMMTGKCVLKLCRTSMIKPRQIERSVFFHNGQTTIHSLVWGPSEVRFWKNYDFLIENDDPPPPKELLGLCICLMKYNLGKIWGKFRHRIHYFEPSFLCIQFGFALIFSLSKLVRKTKIGSAMVVRTSS